MKVSDIISAAKNIGKGVLSSASETFSKARAAAKNIRFKDMFSGAINTGNSTIRNWFVPLGLKNIGALSEEGVGIAEAAKIVGKQSGGPIKDLIESLSISDGGIIPPETLNSLKFSKDFLAGSLSGGVTMQDVSNVSSAITKSNEPLRTIGSGIASAVTGAGVRNAAIGATIGGIMGAVNDDESGDRLRSGLYGFARGAVAGAAGTAITGGIHGLMTEYAKFTPNKVSGNINTLNDITRIIGGW